MTAAEEDRRVLRLASICTLALALAGAMCVPQVVKWSLKYRAFFYDQYVRIEPPAISLIAVAAIAVLVLSFRASPDDSPLTVPEPSPRATKLLLWGAIAFVIVVVLVGFPVAFHGYFLADDEFSGWFQAVIFAHGKSYASISPEWCRWIDALAPTSVNVTGCAWKLGDPSLHALFRGAFIALHVDFLAGPLAAAATLWLVASTAARLWPDRPHRTWVTILVLATSTQFLFMSMTMFSMPTHLLVSALWLRLYVDGRKAALLALPLVGFIALGVHSPAPHLLWVTPLVLRFLWQRRWRMFAYLSLVYACSLAFWVNQFRTYGRIPEANPFAASIATVAVTTNTVNAFALPGITDSVTSVMHLALIATWNNPIVLVLLLVAALTWRHLDTILRDLLLGLLIMIAARCFRLNSQGEGWGYRYIYDALSNIALLSAFGFDVTVRAIGRRRATTLLGASLVASVVIQIPMRVAGVRSVVGPYALAHQWMTQRKEQIVVFNRDDALWGRQMLRNDPFLRNSPKLMDLRSMPKNSLGKLQQLYPGQVRVVTPEELTQFGVERAPLRFGNLIIAR